MAGIVGYGAYVPSYRIKVEKLQKYGRRSESISNGLVVNEKSVPASDEDATIAVTAARNH